MSGNARDRRSLRRSHPITQAVQGTMNLFSDSMHARQALRAAIDDSTDRLGTLLITFSIFLVWGVGVYAFDRAVWWTLVVPGLLLGFGIVNYIIGNILVQRAKERCLIIRAAMDEAGIKVQNAEND